VTGYTACVTACDVLLSRVHDGLGQSLDGLSGSAPGSGEELWALTAEGQTSLIIHPFTDALDVALTWAVESGGKIYRRDQPGAEPRLYNGAW
jgi:hypothetical protein